MTLWHKTDGLSFFLYSKSILEVNIVSIVEWWPLLNNIFFHHTLIDIIVNYINLTSLIVVFFHLLIPENCNFTIHKIFSSINLYGRYRRGEIK